MGSGFRYEDEQSLQIQDKKKISILQTEVFIQLDS